MNKLKPIPANNKGMPNLPKSVRNKMGYMARGGKARKGYAYGSMVRKPMYGGGMAMSANPMMDRKEKMGMMYGGMAKKKKG